MATNAESLWNWVDNRCVHLGIDSIRELERRSGVSYGAIYRPKSELKLPTVESSIKMSKSLKVDFVEFWSHAGIVKGPQLSGYKADIICLIEDESEETLRQLFFIIESVLRIKNS